MRQCRRVLAVLVSAGLVAAALSGCGAGGGDKRQIIRIGHNQATDHPTNIALMAFEEYIEEKLGDKYNVEVYPSELLGSQTDMVQLTQTIPYMLWYYVAILIGLLLVTYIPFLNIGLPTAAGLI